MPLLWSPMTTICGSVRLADLHVDRTRSRIVSLSLKLVILVGGAGGYIVRFRIKIYYVLGVELFWRISWHNDQKKLHLPFEWIKVFEN
mgnify:CR=1 FL=1